jgi:hypothetical protein
MVQGFVSLVGSTSAGDRGLTLFLGVFLGVLPGLEMGGLLCGLRLGDLGGVLEAAAFGPVLGWGGGILLVADSFRMLAMRFSCPGSIWWEPRAFAFFAACTIS